MHVKRVESNVTRPDPVEITVDGKPMPAYPGESLAAALLAGGLRAFRETGPPGSRGAFCNMGVCFACIVTVDGTANVRACVTPVRRGMRVVRQNGADGERMAADGTD